MTIRAFKSGNRVEYCLSDDHSGTQIGSDHDHSDLIISGNRVESCPLSRPLEEVPWKKMMTNVCLLPVRQSVYDSSNYTVNVYLSIA